MARTYKLKCKYKDCDKKETSRGLCQNHYGAALRVVKRGLITWKELEANGKSRPAKKGCIKKHSDTMAWFVDNDTNVSVPEEKPTFRFDRSEYDEEAETNVHLELVNKERNNLLRSKLSRLTKLYTDTHSIAKNIQNEISILSDEFNRIKNT